MNSVEKNLTKQYEFTEKILNVASDLMLKINMDDISRKSELEKIIEDYILSEQETSVSLNDFFGDIPFPVLIFDQNKTLKLANEKFCHMMGYEAHELIGLEKDEYVKLFFSREMQENIQRGNFKCHDISDYLTVFTHKNRTNFLCQNFVRPLKNKKGNSIGFIWFVLDRNDKNELFALRQQSAFMLDNMPVGVVVVNNDGILSYVNEQYCTMVGLTPGEIIGRESKEFNNEIFGKEETIISNVFKTGETLVNVEEEVIMHSRDRRLRQVSSAPIYGEDHRLIGVISLVNDVTEQRKWEEQAALADKNALVSQMAASLAHEVRNPLTSVKTFLQVLQSKENQNSTNQELYDLVITEVDRANAIITNFLNFAKADGGKQEVFSFISLWEKVRDIIAAEALLLNIQLVYRLPQNVVNIYGDKEELTQVILNLSRNALEAMPDGGVLLIAGNVEGENLHIKVADTGIGISEHDAIKIFQPFYTTKDTGTGLGLAICQRIIHAHGGTVSAKPRKGKGTEFNIMLPVVCEPQE